ncbi:hypothetical protein LMG26684_05724 [Achromobacter mucicolens]|uniref:Uncharacterized protein n=2 Tax=Alcaligenaceae TaxID=506 RepID=A0AAD2J4L0_ACHAE|nr:hypothetical protein LMG26684_05724 [Achromobacter mucicolens]CUJ70290.1 Uncharacterised protein [Achromobacter aegrifaciens]
MRMAAARPTTGALNESVEQDLGAGTQDSRSQPRHRQNCVDGILRISGTRLRHGTRVFVRCRRCRCAVFRHLRLWCDPVRHQDNQRSRIAVSLDLEARTRIHSFDRALGLHRRHAHRARECRSSPCQGKAADSGPRFGRIVPFVERRNLLSLLARIILVMSTNAMNKENAIATNYFSAILARRALIGKLLFFGTAIVISYNTGLMNSRSESAQPVLQADRNFEIRKAAMMHVARNTLEAGEPTMISALSAVVTVRRIGDSSDTGCDVLAQKLLVPGSQTLGVWTVSADKCSPSH